MTWGRKTIGYTNFWPMIQWLIERDYSVVFDYDSGTIEAVKKQLIKVDIPEGGGPNDNLI